MRTRETIESPRAPTRRWYSDHESHRFVTIGTEADVDDQRYVELHVVRHDLMHAFISVLVRGLRQFELELVVDE